MVAEVGVRSDAYGKIDWKNPKEEDTRSDGDKARKFASGVGVRIRASQVTAACQDVRSEYWPVDLGQTQAQAIVHIEFVWPVDLGQTQTQAIVYIEIVWPVVLGQTQAQAKIDSLVHCPTLRHRDSCLKIDLILVTRCHPKIGGKPPEQEQQHQS